MLSANGTIPGGVTDTSEGCAAMQRVSDRLEKWPGRNLMKFYKVKCKVLHLGRNNPRHQHTPGASQLESSLTEKDLGCSGGHQVDLELPLQQRRLKERLWILLLQRYSKTI